MDAPSMSSDDESEELRRMRVRLAERRTAEKQLNNDAQMSSDDEEEDNNDEMSLSSSSSSSEESGTTNNNAEGTISTSIHRCRRSSSTDSTTTSARNDSARNFSSSDEKENDRQKQQQHNATTSSYHSPHLQKDSIDTSFKDQDKSSARLTQASPLSSARQPGSAHSAGSFPILDEAALLDLDRQIEQVNKTKNELMITTTPLQHSMSTMTPASKGSTSSFPMLDQAALDKLDNQISQFIQNETPSSLCQALNAYPESNKDSPTLGRAASSASASDSPMLDLTDKSSNASPATSSDTPLRPSEQSTGCVFLLHQATLEQSDRENIEKAKDSENETSPSSSRSPAKLQPDSSDHSVDSFPLLDRAALDVLDRRTKVVDTEDDSSDDDDSLPTSSSSHSVNVECPESKNSSSSSGFSHFDQAAWKALDRQIEERLLSPMTAPQKNNSSDIKTQTPESRADEITSPSLSTNATTSTSSSSSSKICDVPLSENVSKAIVKTGRSLCSPLLLASSTHSFPTAPAPARTKHKSTVHDRHASSSSYCSSSSSSSSTSSSEASTPEQKKQKSINPEYQAIAVARQGNRNPRSTGTDTVVGSIEKVSTTRANNKADSPESSSSSSASSLEASTQKREEKSPRKPNQTTATTRKGNQASRPIASSHFFGSTANVSKARANVGVNSPGSLSSDTTGEDTSGDSFVNGDRTPHEQQGQVLEDEEFDRAFGFVDSQEPARNDKTRQQESEESTRVDQAFGAEVPPDPIGNNGSQMASAVSSNDIDGLPLSQDDEESIESTCIDSDDRIAEIEPKYYQPPPFVVKQPPIVHEFTAANKPLPSRQMMPVSQIFQQPVSSLWKNKFQTFNSMQSEVVQTMAFSDDNMVLSAPTGAGKTAVFEMAMARFFAVDLQTQSQQRGTSHVISKHRKIVYLSPSKALCEERFVDWSKRLMDTNCGIEVALVTGDGDPSASFRDLAGAHLILSTPEKWDSLTRRWTESFFLFASVKLFLIDEVHLIADDSRGHCLESVFARMKSIQLAAQTAKVTQEDIQVSSYTNTTPEAFNSPMRTVAISATLPNIAEIASFLEANEAYVFDSSYRPVPLTTHVIGQGFIGNASNSQFRFWASLDRNVPEIINRFSGKKPSIVFCHSKADTEKLADLLAMSKGIGYRSNSNSEMASRTKVPKLQRVLFHGIGFHHAGLEVDDRRLVEQSFIQGKIRVLCATSTLAMGVNLPAHLVVIKGTKAWRGSGSGYQDLDQATLLQMIGRAGRPGFDTSGTAVIMTDNKSKALFQRLASSGLDPAISKLPSKIDAVMNAEIAQKVIQSTDDAINWLGTTLFSIQFLKDPSQFGVEVSPTENPYSYLFSLCSDAIKRLLAIGAIASRETQQLLALPPSSIMSQHLVEYQAMQLFVEVSHDATQCQVLKTLVQIEGLHRPVRRSEKRFLKETHKSLRYKLDGPLSKVTIQTPSEKAFVLLQASITNVEITDYTLRQEMASMLEFSSRMLAALEEYSVKATRHGSVIVESLKLRRSFATGIWSVNEGVLNQLNGVGRTTTFSLKLSGISSFADVLGSSDEKIEKAAKRLSPFGSTLKKAVSKILKDTLKMSARIEYAEGTRTPSHLLCKLERRAPIDSLGAASNSNGPEVSYTLVAYTDRPGGCVIYRRNVSEPGCYSVQVPPVFSKVTLCLIASLVGLDEKVELEGNDTSANARRPSISTDEGTRTAGARRIRNMNQISNKKSKKDEGTANTRTGGRAASQERVPFKSGAGYQVTPSPKPGLGADSPRKDGLGTSQKSSHSHAGWGTSNLPSHESMTAQVPVESQRASSQSEGWASSQPPPIYAPMPQQLPQPPQPASIQQNSFYREGAAKRPMQTTPSNVNQKDQFSWKKARIRQEKVQQRAFVNKRDNPFSSFKHDPNDSESFLDALSSSSQNHKSPESSIIPPEGLQALRNAYRGSSIGRMNHSQSAPRQTRYNRHIQRRPRGPSVQEILMEKEREMYQPALTGGAHHLGSHPALGSPIFVSQPPPGSSWQDVASPYASSSVYYDNMRMNIPTSYSTLQHPVSHVFGAQNQQFQPQHNSASQVDHRPDLTYTGFGFDEIASQVDLSMVQTQAGIGQSPYHSTSQTAYMQGEPLYYADSSRTSTNPEAFSPTNQGLYGQNGGAEPQNHKYQEGQTDDWDIEAAFF